MKRIISISVILLLTTTLLFAGSKSKKQWIKSLPRDNVVYAPGGVQSDAGIVNIVDSFNYVAAKSATRHAAVEIATATIVGSTVAPTITQSAEPRNVQVIAVFDENNSTATITATLAIVGVNARGVSDSESISFSTTSAQGSKAWSKIDSLTVTVSTYTAGTNATKVTYNIGNHDKLGLSNSVDAVGDVIHIRDHTSAITPSASNIDVTNNTYTPTETPNNTNYDIRYNVKQK